VDTSGLFATSIFMLIKLCVVYYHQKCLMQLISQLNDMFDKGSVETVFLNLNIF
jgi:hypothetical protein